jgi:hypothetical protein
MFCKSNSWDLAAFSPEPLLNLWCSSSIIMPAVLLYSFSISFLLAGLTLPNTHLTAWFHLLWEI